MVFCRYEKTKTAVYTPHLDLLRSVMMAGRRGELDINYSIGFNPHARIFFVQPLPIGIGSECEYMTIDTDETPQDVMDKLNSSLQDGIRVLKAATTDNNPNIAKMMHKADYEIVFENDVDLGDLSQILKQETYEISFMQKGKSMTKDVRKMIYSLAGEGKVYNFRLACGNINLRADRLIHHLLEQIGKPDEYFRIVRKQLYTEKDENIDTLFFK